MEEEEPRTRRGIKRLYRPRRTRASKAAKDEDGKRKGLRRINQVTQNCSASERESFCASRGKLRGSERLAG